MRQLRLIFASLFSTLARRLRRGPRRAGWSFTFEFVVELLRRDWAELRSWPVDRVRRDLANKPAPKTATRRVSKRDIELDGIRALEIAPPSARTDAVVFYLHGGSYAFGSPETHADIAARFALAAGARVVLPDYRLAPEHPYPAALDDARRAYRALAKDVGDARIGVAGESAGAHLALSLVLDGAHPRALALMSPWLDPSASRASTRGQPDDYGDREMLVMHAKLFAGDVPLDDPRIELLARELGGLPPTLVQVGGAERLLDEALDLDRRARAAGLDVTLDVLPEMPHAAQLLAEWSPTGQSAIERAAAFLVDGSRRPIGEASPA
jgi:acetyl esterase/lipase